MTINQDRFARFSEVYRAALIAAIERKPADYAYPVTDAPAVADRMLAAVARGSANMDSPAFRSTCRTLGIKHTRKAITTYIEGA